MVGDEDPFSIFSFSLYDAEARKLTETLVAEKAKIESMPKAELTMLCQEVRGLGNTARQCKETYLGLINEALRRLSITVGEAEGKEAFRDDVNQLRLWINRVLETGLAHSPGISFLDDRYEKVKENTVVLKRRRLLSRT